MTAAAFQATYSDWRLVKGRKVIQIVFEVPLEGGGLAYDVLGGMPDPSKSVWCAIARMKSGATEERTKESSKTEPPLHGSPASSPPSPTARGDKRLVQQAAMCCADPVFQRYLGLRLHGYEEAIGEHEAADFVRYECRVKTRKDILLGTPAAERWDHLYSQFVAWRTA